VIKIEELARVAPEWFEENCRNSQKEGGTQDIISANGRRFLTRMKLREKDEGLGPNEIAGNRRRIIERRRCLLPSCSWRCSPGGLRGVCRDRTAKERG